MRLLFYTLGDLAKPGLDKQPGVTANGKAAFLEIHGGRDLSGCTVRRIRITVRRVEEELLRDVD